MRPTLFSLFGFDMSSYYFMGMLSVIIGMFMTAREADRIKLDRRIALNTALLLCLLGYIGARIQHIIFDGFFEIYLQKPIAILYVWKGGLAFYGAVVFGLLAVVGYLSYKKQVIAAYLDIFTYPLALGIALGRVGCYLNGCCFGKVSTGPLSQTFITNGLSAKKQYLDNMLSSLSQTPYPVINTQLIESTLCFILFFFIFLYLRFRYTKPGTIFGTWLMGYAVIRFIIEIFRDDDRGLFFGNLLSTSQIIALVSGLTGLLLLILPAEKIASKTSQIP